MKKRRPKVVVVGSINMDLVLSCEHLPKAGETLAARECLEVSGGKGANQAVAAARMGADVRLIGRVGNDVFGHQLLKSLEESNVNIEQVKVCNDCGSGLAVVMVEAAGQNSIVIVPGANGRLSRADIREEAHHIRAADMLVVQLEVPLEAIEEAIAIARAAGVKVILNPAPAARNLPATLYQVDILCPNQSEAELMTGIEVDSFEAAKRAGAELISRGTTQVVITLGKDGACLCEQGESEARFTLIPSIAIEVVDTTAAGDAFLGALAIYVSEYQELSAACRKACIAGALAATKLGAQTSLPWRTEVEAKLVAVDSKQS